jgi:hypothetical protein
MANSDIANRLRDDRGGAELRRVQRELRLGRDNFCSDPTAVNREGVAKAFDSGIALLPELWRLEQRK